jgi:hypothetical protein
LIRQLLSSVLAGQPLSSGANRELARLAKQRGMDASQYAQLVLQSLVGQ